MGRLARSTPDDSSVQAMLWLLESYDATAVPLAGQSGLLARVAPPAEPEPPSSPAPTSWPTLRAVAVLEHAPEVVEDVDDVEPAAEALDPIELALADSPPVLLAEQRLEPRIDCALAVAAAAQSDTAETAIGETVNLSVSGVHLVMDRAADVGPIDLIVGEVVVQARVVDHREVGDGRHAWHVHVLDDDGSWLDLVGAALGS